MTESNRVAKPPLLVGYPQGDPVLLVLKRSYLFWYCMLALQNRCYRGSGDTCSPQRTISTAATREK